MEVYHQCKFIEQNYGFPSISRKPCLFVFFRRVVNRMFIRWIWWWRCCPIPNMTMGQECRLTRPTPVLSSLCQEYNPFVSISIAWPLKSRQFVMFSHRWIHLLTNPYPQLDLNMPLRCFQNSRFVGCSKGCPENLTILRKKLRYSGILLCCFTPNVPIVVVCYTYIGL